jgi:ectoine hydroxylase-related dioxygenase (phytanoyl-CoA dioxygenase family)|tara:strand:+ start:44 stop:289 length:246 start_codon:yes stop_codon:yes gene_type:complete
MPQVGAAQGRDGLLIIENFVSGEVLPRVSNFDDKCGVPLEVAAGTLMVLHDYLPHYSTTNRIQCSRYASALHTISASVEYS